LSELDPEFFELTMGIVNRKIEQYDEEVKWVLKTNLFTFVIEHVLDGKGSAII
jgi:hypothetical protein